MNYRDPIIHSIIYVLILYSRPKLVYKKALEQRTFSTFDIIQTRPWNFLDILKVPVFYRYLQVQIPKKATFRIQIKRFFHICFHEGLIPYPSITKLTTVYSSSPFYIPVKHWVCRKDFLL